MFAWPSLVVANRILVTTQLTRLVDPDFFLKMVTRNSRWTDVSKLQLAWHNSLFLMPCDIHRINISAYGDFRYIDMI